MEKKYERVTAADATCVFSASVHGNSLQRYNFCTSLCNYIHTAYFVIVRTAYFNYIQIVRTAYFVRQIDENYSIEI